MGGDMGKVLQLFKTAAQREMEEDCEHQLMKDCGSGDMVNGKTVIIVHGDWVMCCEKKGRDR